jgi:two-component system chemotaxis response regulator CheB
MSLNKTKRTKVLVVDDSAFMRKALSIMIESDPSLEVVGSARDGNEAIEKVESLNPDLVTLDVEMPRMGGLEALKSIMESNPVPVLMVSSMTNEGAGATLDALELGAIDFIPKKLSYVSLDILKIKEELLSKIKHIAKRKHVLMARYKCFKACKTASKIASSVAPPPIINSENRIKFAKKYTNRLSHPINIIAIGCSTGGPMALQKIIPGIPPSIPSPIIIAQHMPETFTASLAERLNVLSRINVKEAENNEPVEIGTVYIAPGGKHLLVKRDGAKAMIYLTEEPKNNLYKPSIDIMMNSIAESYGKYSMGVILTGMGQDGLDGVRTIKEKGGVVIAQDEESCVVYGMPKVIIDAGLSDHISSLDNVINEIADYF